ncbi:MAG: PH domain-containing protein [Deltaproteobacteria bacterium]|nr:PH domain-containing protein [Deltaproteobacteria bacterium]
MSYIENNLMPGEKITYRAYLHWAVFLRPIGWLVIAILFFIGSGYIIGIGTIFVLIAIIDGIGSLITYKTSEFGVTNKRVLVKVGFIRRNSLEILLTKVEGIQVNQGIIGRILGYGSIVISGTGGSKDPLHKISAPLEFRKRSQEQVVAVQESK